MSKGLTGSRWGWYHRLWPQQEWRTRSLGPKGAEDVSKEAGGYRIGKRYLGEFEFYLVRQQEALKQSANGREPVSTL